MAKFWWRKLTYPPKGSKPLVNQGLQVLELSVTVDLIVGHVGPRCVPGYGKS